MSLKLVSLASGSKGNATLIFSDTTAVLVDAGISFTRISRELKDFGLTPSLLDGVIITHEHSDHIAALPKLSEYVPVYAHEKTACAIKRKQGELKNYTEVEYYECGFTIGDIEVTPFRVPHDAVYPLAYTFKCGAAKVSVATDIGVPTKGVVRNIIDSDAVLLESNHDLNMLKNGNYAPYLKERILSQNGHLSNDAAALVAKFLAGGRTHSLMLGHLSLENNRPELALNAVGNALNERNCTEMELYLAYPDRRSEVFEI